MKNKCLYIIISTTVIILIGVAFIFHVSQSFRSELLLADSLMGSKPDSSLVILNRIENLKCLSEKETALYALLRVQAQFKNRQYPTSDSLIRIAYNYYIPGEDSVRKAQVYFYQARINEYLGNRKEAIKKYQQASFSGLPTNNYELLALIYSHWGLLLRKLHIYDEALIVQSKSLKYSLLLNDTIKQIYAFKNIGSIYTSSQKFDQALIYYKRALYLAKLINNASLISDVYNCLGLLNKYVGRYEASLYYVNKSLSLLSDSTFFYSRSLLKGDIFSLKHQYDSSRYYMEMGRRKSDISSEATFCSIMSQLEERLGNYKSALLFSKKYINYISKIVESEKEDAIVELQKKYDFTLVENENNQLRISEQKKKNIILAISFVAFIAVFLLLYYYNRKRVMKKVMKEELHRMEENMLKQQIIFDQQKAIEKQSIQNVMLIKEQEMSMELLHTTEALKHHQEKERELKDRIFKMDTIVRKINEFNSMKPLQRSKSESRFTLSFQELSDLEESVNLCYNNFAIRLRVEFPKLKDDDIHLCCLLKMKIPNKNILSLLDTNELAMKKRRYRIKHDKMELPDDFSSLDEFLLNY